MTREELEQCLLWSGFKAINRQWSYTVYNKDYLTLHVFNNYLHFYKNKEYFYEFNYKSRDDNLIKLIEILIGEKLITEEPKPSIKEQLTDCKVGDFITFRDIKLGVKKAVFVKLSDYWIHFFYKNENGRDTMACGHPVDSIQEIIKIQHNKYNILNNYEEFCNEK